MADNAPIIGPVRNNKDLSALLDILSATFGFSRPQGDEYSRIVGVRNYRVIRRGSEVLGGCALLPLGQYFGGKSVPMIGIAAVGIAPQHRGQRTATLLMSAAVKETHKRGIPISSLYPATLPLYRSVGYEHAGYRFELRVPAKPLIMRARDDMHDVRRITEKDRKSIEQLYEQKAKISPGNLDRSDFIWHRVRQPRGSQATGFIFVNRKTRKPEGYVYYVQKESGLPHDLAHSPFSLHLTDFAAATPEAGRRILSFLGNHRSMTHEIIWQGNPNDPILKLLPERNYSARLLDHWMVRVADVKRALESRGYPPMSGEVHLEVMDDDLITSNNGRWTLKVQNGKPKVSTGGDGDWRIDIRGLASLYSGHLSPSELQITGQLKASNGKSRDLETFATLFAGPSPWMGDMF